MVEIRWLVVPEIKMFTDNARRSTHDDRRQTIAIGRLSDSGDLKTDVPVQSGCVEVLANNIYETEFQCNSRYMAEIRRKTLFN